MKKKLPLLLSLMLVNAFAQEESEGLRAMRLSCEKHKVGLGCFNYANMLQRREIGEPDKYFKLGCELKHQPSCQQEKWDLPALEASAKTGPEEPVLEKPATEEPTVITVETPTEPESDAEALYGETVTEVKPETVIEPLAEEKPAVEEAKVAEEEKPAEPEKSAEVTPAPAPTPPPAPAPASVAPTAMGGAVPMTESYSAGQPPVVQGETFKYDYAKPETYDKPKTESFGTMPKTTN